MYVREAGTKAFTRSAYTDAVSYFTRGLEIAATLPASSQRERHEMALLLALGPTIQAIKGLGAPEAERMFSRARELSELIRERIADTIRRLHLAVQSPCARASAKPSPPCL